MKNLYILGISCFYHDSAACIIKNGEIIAAAQEERFTRKKHDSDFPENAVNYCIKEAGVNISEIEYVVFYEKPFLKFERILEISLDYAPKGIKQFMKSVPVWIKQKLYTKKLIKDKLNYQGKICFAGHHESHAASAFYPSPFKDAAILTLDGVGEWTTTSISAGEGNEIKMCCEQVFPDSLGLLYAAFTYYTGFKINDGEYKMMGLAPYGEPKYKDIILKELVDVREDGSIKLNMKYFSYCTGLKMVNKRFERIMGGPARNPEARITQRDMDIAKSIQEVTEEIIIKMAKHAAKVTGKRNLCMAGGVALNCVANGKLYTAGIFDNIWIQPASSDSGGALGAALAVWYKYLKNERVVDGKNDLQKGSYLGPSYDDIEVENIINKYNLKYEKIDKNDISNIVSDFIIKENIVGWFQGRMEYGPRALGSRSIIGDPRSQSMQSIINKKIKFRESFRPLAPSILEEHMLDYFDFELKNPYMLFVLDIKKDKRIPVDNSLSGLDKLKAKRSDVPSITHVDYSVRIQTVSKKLNALYHDLINEFYKKTGCPLIVNTSFNLRSEPIVCTPEDALKCFLNTYMDILVMNNFIIKKESQVVEENVQVGLWGETND